MSRSGTHTQRITLCVFLVSTFFLLLVYLLSTPSYHGLAVIGTSTPKTALILTAHPDDEVMFFSPVILALVAMGWEVRGLCLSTGDEAGLGDVRRRELFASYQGLGVHEKDVQVLDHPSLQDGMHNHWEPQIIAGIVADHLDRSPVSLIVTFDHQGITSHPNHTPLPKAIPLLPESLRPMLLTLHSPSTLSKFTGIALPIYHRLTSRLPFHASEKIIVVSSIKGYIQSVRAMMRHWSQLVWFRFLYLGFSRLMWINELELR